MGLNILPLLNTPIGENFVLRPEVRFDYSDKAFFDVSSAGTGGKHNQTTIGIDAIFNF